MTTLEAGTGQALLREIIDHPERGDARLVYADWLEEYGDEKGARKASMIRGTFDSAGPVRFVTTFPGLSKLEADLEHAAGRECFRVIDGFVHRGPEGREDGPAIEIRRGFLCRVRLPLAAWREHGPRLVREHPLTRVELSDRRPVLGDAGSGTEGKSGWFDEEGGADPEDLPFGLWSLLPGGDRCGMVYWKFYPSEPDALSALSDALLAWARLPENAPRAD